MPPSPPAPLWLRFAAAVYDLFPLMALWMLTAGLCLLAVGGHVDVAHPPLAWRLLLRGALLLVTAAYFVVSWCRGGQTIGMRAWRIRVVAQGGHSLGAARAGARFALCLVSLLAAGLGYLWCLWEQDRRGWHDLATGCQVLRLTK